MGYEKLRKKITFPANVCNAVFRVQNVCLACHIRSLAYRRIWIYQKTFVIFVPLIPFSVNSAYTSFGILKIVSGLQQLIPDI